MNRARRRLGLSAGRRTPALVPENQRVRIFIQANGYVVVEFTGLVTNVATPAYFTPKSALSFSWALIKAAWTAWRNPQK